MDGSDDKCAHLLDLPGVVHVVQTESGSSEQLGSAGVNGSIGNDGSSAIDRAEQTDGERAADEDSLVNAEKGQHYDENRADKQENQEITAMSDGTSMTSVEDSQDQRNDDLPSETEDISNRTPDLENGKASKANVNVFRSAKSALTTKKAKRTSSASTRKPLQSTNRSNQDDGNASNKKSSNEKCRTCREAQRILSEVGGEASGHGRREDSVGSQDKERARGGSEAAAEEPEVQGHAHAELLPRGSVPQSRVQEAAHDPAQVAEAGPEEDDDRHGDLQLLVGERRRRERVTAVLPRQPWRRLRQQLQMQRQGRERQAGGGQEEAAAAAEAPRPRECHQHRGALAAVQEDDSNGVREDFFPSLSYESSLLDGL